MMIPLLRISSTTQLGLQGLLALVRHQDARPSILCHTSILVGLLQQHSSDDVLAELVVTIMSCATEQAVQPGSFLTCPERTLSNTLIASAVRFLRSPSSCYQTVRLALHLILHMIIWTPRAFDREKDPLNIVVAFLGSRHFEVRLRALRAYLALHAPACLLLLLLLLWLRLRLLR